VRGASVHDEVRRRAIHARLPRLLVAAKQEDGVVGGGGDGQQRQQVGRVGGQRDDAEVAEDGDHTPGGGHLDGDRHHRDQRGGDRPVDEEQHDRDYAECERGDLDVALLADRELVGDQCRRTADVGLHPGWRRSLVDDVAHGDHRLIRLAAAGVTGQVRVDQGGLAVVALRPRRGQRVTPEVLNMLDVLLVGRHAGNQGVSVAVRLLTERLSPLDHDGGEAVGVVLAEHLSHPLAGDHRRCVLGGLCDVVDPTHFLEWRNECIGGGGQRQPEDGDRNRELADQVGDAGRAFGGAEAHPDLSRQNT